MIDTSSEYQLFEVLEKGGLLMVPLAICSLLAVAIVVERLIWGPSRWRVIPKTLYQEILCLLEKRRFDELMGLCRGNSSPLAQIVFVAVSNARRSREEIIDAIEITGRAETLRLHRFVGILGTIAAISPLLGLLGTVFGMISTFSVIGEHGVGNAPALASGIAEALITTASGLTIAIPSLVFYRYFLHKAKKLVLEMEAISLTVVDQISRAKESEPGLELTVGKQHAL